MVQQRIHGRMIPDRVTILFAGGVETSVESRTGACSRNDPNVFRQPGIERQSELAGRRFPLLIRRFEVSDHAEGMNAGIGAAGAMETRMTGKKFREGCLDLFLDTGPGLLHLPAFVTGAIVGDDEF